MKRPCFQFTIGRLVQLVALAAFGSYLLRVGSWGLVVAWLVTLSGFVVDRTRGGSGILGSMIVGLLGGGMLGFADRVYWDLTRGPTGSFISPGTVVMECAIGGLTTGTVFGVGAWAILSLGRLLGRLRTRWLPGPKPDHGDSQDPAVRVSAVLPDGRNE
ncbi:MAG: hypothetical protein ACYC61_25795 [Isosphaeraceae bacterium]